MVLMILHAGQQKRLRYKEQTFELSGRRQGWDGSRKEHWNMCIIIWKIDDQCKFDAWSWAPKDCALGQPERWGGKEVGGVVQNGRDTCIPVAESCCCMVKTIAIL